MKKLIALFLLALIFSCKTPESITTTNDTFRFVEREIKDTTIAGFNVNTTLSLPEITELRIYDTIEIIDPVTKGQLRLWKNKYGDLVADCQGQNQTITKLKERVHSLESRESEKVVHVDPRNWWQKLMDFIPWYAYLIGGCIVGMAVRIRVL